MYNFQDVFIDENGVPFHFKCVVLCPVCKQVILYRETSRKAPTGEYWCEKCFDGHWICCVCNKQLSEAETGSQLPCCGKKWRHETCQHGHGIVCMYNYVNVVLSCPMSTYRLFSPAHGDLSLTMVTDPSF